MIKNRDLDDPVDPHPEESLKLLIEELVRASRELLATPVREGEDPRMTQLRRDLQAALDEWGPAPWRKISPS